MTLPKESNPPADDEMTPEQASELLRNFDFSSPFYYTFRKSRDPFEEMREGRGEEKRPRRWRFWTRGS